MRLSKFARSLRLVIYSITVLSTTVSTLTVSAASQAPLTSADIYSITNGHAFYDATDSGALCNADGVTAGSPIVGDSQSLAQQIVNNPNITYDGGPAGPTGTQFKRLAAGQKAQTDDGREVDSVQPIILITVLHLAQGHKVNVSALTDGSSHTNPQGPHGSGKAVDINIFDGSHTNGTDTVAESIAAAAAEVLPVSSRFGLGTNGGINVGARQIGNKTMVSFTDNPTHVHIDVVGVAQPKIDEAVQAVGGVGAASVSNTNTAGRCCAQGASDNSGSTPLTGNTPGEQVFNFFIGKGLTNDSAAAATGNLELESSFVTNEWAANGHYGLAQWDRADRYPKLVAFAGSVDNASKINYQLDFIWHELSTGYTSTLDYLHGNASVTDKAIFWGRHFEGAVSGDGTLQGQDQRVADALKWSLGIKGAPSGSSVSAPIGSAGCGAGGAASFGTYSNPFHSTAGLHARRIDEGVDYASDSSVPLYAIGNGKVTLATDKSSFYTTNGGHADWIAYQLSDGPAAGKTVYVSEACPPLVKTGDLVTSATHLCDVLPDSIEMGWAMDPTVQAAAALMEYQGHDGFETAYGVNFNMLLLKLGAPGGQLDTNVDPSGQVLGTLPNGWPKW